MQITKQYFMNYFFQICDGITNVSTISFILNLHGMSFTHSNVIISSVICTVLFASPTSIDHIIHKHHTYIQSMWIQKSMYNAYSTIINGIGLIIRPGLIV